MRPRLLNSSPLQLGTCECMGHFQISPVLHNSYDLTFYHTYLSFLKPSLAYGKLFFVKPQ